ncbi:MAG: glycosyltransferase family 2 protein [Pirellula sp.]|nr:glycosyltransferase family 2 protein [Pirellula sp.]
MKISVVSPVYNEYEVLPYLLDALPKALVKLTDHYEIILVDDGSTDGSDRVIRERAESDSRIKLVQFSRNFGQQAAITAGLDCVTGDIVVVMDCDMQDPPEMLGPMLDKIHQGYDVVSCRRIGRDGESLFKRWSSTAFYQVMRSGIDHRIPPEVGDFRMYTRRAADGLRAFREQHRFMRGLVAWLGLKEAILPFHRPARAAGQTKYPLSKLVKLAWTAISSSSPLPLKASSYLGAAMLWISACAACLFLIGFFADWNATSNLAWVSFLLGLSGLQMTAIGLLGDYVGRVFEESKSRPLYVVSQVCNIERSPEQPRALWLDTHEAQSAVRIEPRVYGPIVLPSTPRKAG